MDDRWTDCPIQQHAERASQVPDISQVVTRLLGPARAANALARSGMQRLQGADAYEREAATLQALAQRMEQDLWDCSEHLD